MARLTSPLLGLLVLVSLQSATFAELPRRVSVRGDSNCYSVERRRDTAYLDIPGKLVVLPEGKASKASNSGTCSLFKNRREALSKLLKGEADSRPALLRTLLRPPLARRCETPVEDKELHRVELVTSGCRLDRFNPRLFLEALRGRTLYLLGDSIMRQTYNVLAHCLLEESRTLAPRMQIASHRKVSEDALGADMTAKTAMMTLAPASSIRDITEGPHQYMPCQRGEVWECSFFGAFSARICRIKAMTHGVSLGNAKCWAGLKPVDYVMANFGLHHNEKAPYRDSVKAFVKFVANSKAEGSLRNVFWMQSSAQHFPNSPGGYYMGDNREPCQAYPLEEMRAREWRNRLADPELRRAQIPVLKTWNTTAGFSAASLHYMQPKGVGAEKHDCAHYCEYPGSIFEVWTTMMQNFLVHAKPFEQHGSSKGNL